MTIAHNKANLFLQTGFNFKMRIFYTFSPVAYLAKLDQFFLKEKNYLFWNKNIRSCENIELPGEMLYLKDFRIASL